MMCSALMTQDDQPAYENLLEQKYTPGVRNLQRILEAAWKEGMLQIIRGEQHLSNGNSGFDQDGAKHYRDGILGSHKWIGTAGVYFVLDESP